MSKVKLNPVFEGFTRKIGNLVFFTRRGDTIARRNTPPFNPNTQAQKTVRGSFSYVARLWTDSKGVMHASWNTFAKGKKFNGYNAFLSANVQKKRQGRALVLFMGMGEEPLLDFTAQSGASAGQVTAAFAMPMDSAGRHLTVFAQLNETGTGYTPFRRFDLGAGAVQPVVIDGLEAGKPYHLYAVLTDAAYPHATRVSASVAVGAVAGV